MEAIITLVIFALVASLLLNRYNKKMQPGLPLNDAIETTLQSEEINLDSFTIKDPIFLNRRSNIPLQIAGFLNEDAIDYTVSGEGALFKILFGQGDTWFDIFISIQKEGAYITFATILYQEIPDVKMNKVAELITRLNETCILGYFNLVYEKRMVTSEAYLILQDQLLTRNFFHLYLQHTIRTGFEYPVLFKRVIEKDEEPIMVLIDFNSQPEKA